MKHHLKDTTRLLHSNLEVAQIHIKSMKSHTEANRCRLLQTGHSQTQIQRSRQSLASHSVWVFGDSANVHLALNTLFTNRFWLGEWAVEKYCVCVLFGNQHKCYCFIWVVNSCAFFATLTLLPSVVAGLNWNNCFFFNSLCIYMYEMGKTLTTQEA